MRPKTPSKKSGRKELKEIPVTRGSGNVFADLGLPNPEERLAKAQLAYAISRVIRERGLTQRAAARLMGIDQQRSRTSCAGGSLTSPPSGSWAFSPGSDATSRSW